MILLYVALTIIILIIVIIKSVWKPDNFPPGPTWKPFVGNLLELKKLAASAGGQYLALTELAKQYKTNVLGLKLGKNLIVVVFSYATVRTVLTSEEYDGRPNSFFIKLRSMGTRKGVTCTDGELWSTQRSFIVRHLRNLGFGGKSMELKINEELKEILEILEDNGSDINIGVLLAPSVINVIWTLIAGSRISRQDSRLTTLLRILGERSKAFDMSGGVLDQYPWLRHIAPNWTGYNLIVNLNQQLKNFFSETIHEHLAKWRDGNDDDLIYSFITEMKRDNEEYTTFTEDQLLMVCVDLFIAGSQTTSNTLDFAFLIMLRYPDIQVKVQAQLDAFIKDNGIPPEYKDRHRVPYVEAVLLEVERYCHIVPICGPRRVLKSTILEGVKIPKDTTVLISLYSVHMDETFWGDPEVFKPERFLDADGKLLSNERLVPFGLGRRRCLGEILARSCIFLFFSGILAKYTITFLPGAEVNREKPLPGITLSPPKYQARFSKRK